MCLAAQSDARVRHLIGIGMMFLVLSFFVETLGHTFRVHAVPLEFVRGAFVGICLGIEMRALWLTRQLRRRTG